MNRAFTIVSVVAIVFLALSAFGGLVWANIIYVRQQPLEKDFFIPWMGARTFLEYGNNPYEQSATERTQLLFYEHLADEGEDPLRLETPFFAELFFLPLALIKDVEVARGIWMTLQEIALAVLPFLLVYLTGWRPARTLLVVYFLFSMLWVHAVISLFSGSPIIFIALFAAGALASLRAERDETSGALLALAVFQPAVTGILILYVLGWAIISRRWRVLWGFLMVIGFLVLISFMIFPGWFLPYLRNIYAGFQGNPGLRPAIILAGWWPALGGKLGWALTIGFTILLLVEWYLSLRKDFRHFFWTASLTIAATPLLGIPVSIVDHVILFIPLTLFLVVVFERWSRSRRWGPAGILLVTLFAGLWAWVYYLGSIAAAGALRSVLFFCIPILTISGLYWLRWFAIHPPRTWLESIRE